ncbi:hypothetical protein AAMO2058_000549000 [Amorphochlora amoebiformis]
MPRSWVPVSRPLPLPLPPLGDNLALNSSRRGNQTLSREEKVGRASIQVMSRDLLRQIVNFLSRRDISVIARSSKRLRRLMGGKFAVDFPGVLYSVKRLREKCKPGLFVPKSLHFRVARDAQSCARVLNFASQAAGRHLEVLSINGSDFGVTRSLDPLILCPALKILKLNACRGLADLSAVKETHLLQELEINSESIQDLTPLASLSALKRLWLRRCSEVKDFGPVGKLASLGSLTHLEISYAPHLIDLTFLQNAKGLCKVTIRHCVTLRDVTTLLGLSPVPALRLVGCPTDVLGSEISQNPDAKSLTPVMTKQLLPYSPPYLPPPPPARTPPTMSLEPTEKYGDQKCVKEEEKGKDPTLFTLDSNSEGDYSSPVFTHPEANPNPNSSPNPSGNVIKISEQERERERKTNKSRRKFNSLVRKAKKHERHAKEGRGRHHWEEALALYQLAESIIPTARNLSRKIRQIQKKSQRTKKLDSEETSKCNGDRILNVVSSNGVATKMVVPKDIYDKLYPYQRDGIKWLWGLRPTGMGGILGDDMGMGKTVQICAFMSAVFKDQRTSSVLIVSPVSVINTWSKELTKWCKNIKSDIFSGSKRQRERKVNKVMGLGQQTDGRYRFDGGGGVLLATYEMVRYNQDLLSTVAWDYLILDEGHLIKNPNTHRYKALQALSAKNRIILSGTPIQNRLLELWALVNFVCKGRLLGDRKTFRNEFSRGIEDGQTRNASSAQRERAKKLTDKLRKIIAPHLLRREKKSVFSDDKSDSKSTKILSTAKNEYVVWVQLSADQLKIYRSFLATPEARKEFCDSKCPLAALTFMKKICDHPQLISSNMKMANSLSPLRPGEKDSKLKRSSKMEVLVELVKSFDSNGDRTLIFSRSKKMLNIIQESIEQLGFAFLRIDGDTNRRERQELIDRYNKPGAKETIFLLTTQVGGLGITLTTANRVVAVDRAYRIGQKRDVMVFRLITCGTVEEVIYRKQVFKGNLMRVAIGRQSRSQVIFSKAELSEVFKFENPFSSHTCLLLNSGTNDKDEKLRPLRTFGNYPQLKCKYVFGVSNHTNVFNIQLQMAPDNQKESESRENACLVGKLRPPLNEIAVNSPTSSVSGSDKSPASSINVSGRSPSCSSALCFSEKFLKSSKTSESNTPIDLTIEIKQLTLEETQPHERAGTSYEQEDVILIE